MKAIYFLLACFVIIYVGLNWGIRSYVLPQLKISDKSKIAAKKVHENKSKETITVTPYKELQIKSNSDLYEEYVYPNSLITVSESNVTTIESTDSFDQVSKWYADRVKKSNVSTVIITSVNNKKQAELEGQKNGNKIRINIKEINSTKIQINISVL